jgi:hypothetical protein
MLIAEGRPPFIVTVGLGCASDGDDRIPPTDGSNCRSRDAPFARLFAL